MTTNITYAPQVDYTSRDYVAIRNDLVNLINRYAPTWTSRDPADLGIAMIELFSYMGDSLNFYIDRAANEGFIGTASQRESILQIASMLGYVPNKLAPATVTLTLTNNDSTATLVPAGTLFSTNAVINGLSTQVLFESDVDVTVPAKVGGVAGTATVVASEGATRSGELVGYSSGAPRQIFKLAYPYVIEDSASVVVNNVSYRYVASLLDYGMQDYVFTTFNDASRNTYIVFGDGINGAVPSAAGQIYASYRVGSGTNGNVPALSITYMLTNTAALLSVTNLDAAIGGADEESTDSIRLTAPKALRSLTRAVSLKDYSSLALQVPGVAKSISASSTINSVTLYISPTGDTGAGVTPTFSALADKVAAYFMDKTPPNSSLTILPPTYVPVDAAFTVYVLPQYKRATVISNFKSVLSSLLSVDNSFFADTLPIQYFMKAASSIQGVDYVTVDILKKQSETRIALWTRSGTTMTITSPAHGITNGQTIKVIANTPTVNLEGNAIAGTINATGVWTATTTTTNTIVFTNSVATGAATSGTVIPTQTPTGSTNITMSTTGAHGIAVGQTVYVSGVTPVGYNGGWSAQTGTTGSTLVLNIGSNPGAITVAGGVALASTDLGTVDLWQGVGTITCATNEIPSEGTIQITGSGGIS